MPANLIGLGGCETKAGDVLVVWGSHGSSYNLSGPLIFTHLKAGYRSWIRTDYYIGISHSCPMVLEDDTGRIFVGYFTDVARHYNFIVSTRGYDGFVQQGESGSTFTWNERVSLLHDRRSGRKFLGMAGTVLREIEWKDGHADWGSDDIGMVQDGMDMLPSGQAIGVDRDGSIFCADFPFTNWRSFERYPQTIMSYRPHSCEIRVGRDGSIFVAGNSLGPREGDKGFAGYGVEDQFGNFTEQPVSGYFRQKPGLVALRSGALIMAISDAIGYREEDGKAAGLYLHISNDGGRTFGALNEVNAGLKKEW